MEDDKKIIDIDKKRVKNLETKGHYTSLLEEFRLLRAKITYKKSLTKKEAHRFITLIKFFLKNTKDEAFKIHLQYLHDKFIKGNKL